MFDKVKSVFRQKGKDKDSQHPHYAPDEYLEQPRDNLLMQKRVTVEVVDGVVYEKTVTRRYMSGSDRYQDSHETKVLATREQVLESSRD